MCRLLGYTKQAYYKQNKRLEQKGIEEAVILEMVKEKRKLWKKGSGRSLYASLQVDFESHQIKIGRDRFFNILRSNGLLLNKHKRRTRTTYSYHHFHKYPNLIKGLEPESSGQILVSDITYVWLKETGNFAYLFLTTDMYSRKIVGYCLSETLKAEAALRTIKMALRNIPDTKNTIHHSDRGIQYCCNGYTRYLQKKGVQLSMTENGDPLENPIAERINRTIKEEFVSEEYIWYTNLTKAREEIEKIVKFYNEERPHSSIDMLTPSEAHKKNGKLKRRWKTYYKSKEEKIAISLHLL